MDMSYLNLENLKIAYLEKNKDASNTIFFFHGNSVSKRCWRKQYDSRQLSAYRVVAIDLPAHGDSDATDISNYNLKGLAKMMCEVVEKLSDGKPYMLAGVSLSTNIIVEMLAWNVKPAGLLLAGPCIVGTGTTIDKLVIPGTHVGVVFTDDADENDIRQYAMETCFTKNEDDINIFIEDYKRVKSPFRSVLGTSIFSGAYSDEIKLLQTHTIATLIIFGKDELVINANYLDDIELPLWNNNIYKIGGASHFVNIDQPETFNNLLEEFAGDIFK